MFEKSMAKVNSVNPDRNASQQVAESVSAAYAARQALNEAQLMSQFSQLLGQAVIQIASQTSERPAEEEKSTADFTSHICQPEPEASTVSHEAVSVTPQEHKSEDEAQETATDSQTSVKTESNQSDAPVVAPKQENKAEAPIAQKVSEQVVAAQCVKPVEAQIQQVVAVAQTEAAVVATAQTVKASDVAVEVATQTKPVAQTAVVQNASQVAVAAGQSENAALQSEEKSAQALIMQTPVKALPTSEAQVTTQSSNPAEVLANAKNSPAAAQTTPAAQAQTTVAPAANPEPAQATQSSPETQDLVIRVMQDIREKAARSEVKPDAAAAPTSKAAFQYQTAGVTTASTVQPQALQGLEKSLRFQTIGQSQMIELAQSAGREASRVQNIQSALNLTAAAAAAGKNEQNSTSSRDADSAKAPKFLTRADTLRTLERVENAIKEVAKSHDGKTISVRLDPPSLGSLKIDLTMRDGSIHARIVAELPQVASMLREKVHELQTLIRQVGFDADQVSVSVGQQNSEEDRQTEYLAQSWYGSNAREGTGTSASGEADAAAVKGKISAGKQMDDHWVA